MAYLKLFLFGSPYLELDGVALELERRKMLALLAYLAVMEQPQSRDTLATLLWPEADQSRARSALRRDLSVLKKALGEAWLILGQETVGLTLSADLWIDVACFRRELAMCRTHGHDSATVCPACLPHLRQAVTLYRADFLAGFTLRDSLVFDEWQAFQTEELRRELAEALERLVQGQSAQDNFKTAIPYARRWLALDPLHEPAHRRLIELYGRAGQRAAALRQFAECQRILQAELGAPPGPKTVALVERIRQELAGQQGQLIRSYELHERIGTGGFGQVYRAYQPQVRREVAIKVILPQYANQPDFIRRFEAEAHMVAQLEHPHIVPLYDYWREPDGAYLVMRWLRGGSLEATLERGPWPPEATAHLLAQIASALALAHQRGIIHRDIKPANILLDEFGNAYLSDFGIAKQTTPPVTPARPGQVVGSPAYISPEAVNGEPLTPQTDIYSLGVVLYEMLTGQHPFADTSPADLLFKQLTEPLPSLRAAQPDLPAGLDAVIQRATAKTPADRYPDVKSLAVAFRQVLTAGHDSNLADEALPLLLPNPYKGLHAFQEGDAADFFGRETFIAQLLTRLKETGSSETKPSPAPPHPGPSARFLALLGPSGSGKSSVVKAGLIPALRQGALPGSERWFIIELTPGAQPWEEMEAALLRIAINPPPALLDQLRADERGLLRAVKRILPDDETQLLLVIDQFEELFTLVEDETVRSHFLNSLRIAVTDLRSQLRVIVTLRADFYDRPLLYPGFGQLLRDRMETILPLSPAELEAAISGPARRIGATLEPGLAPLIIADVQEQPGTLPLLQYALTELYEQRQGRRLTLAAYQASGGVLGALARRADELYTDLDDAGRAAARRLFLRLVAVGEGAEETRRRVLRSELEALTGDRRGAEEQGSGGDEENLTIQNPKSKIQNVIDRFGRHRLLTFDHDPVTRGPTVEVAHEALLRAWGRLRQWLDEDREFLLWQQRLRAGLRQWQANDQDEGALLRGAPLAEAENWFNQRGADLNEAERQFIQAGLALRERRAAEQEAQRRRELEAAQKLAETERQRAEEQTRSARQLRRRAVFLSGALLVAAVLAVAALFFGQRASQNAAQAEREARAATARELAAAAVTNLEVDPERSILLALQAITTTTGDDGLVLPEAIDALHQALPASRVRLTLTGHTEQVYLGIFSPDGAYIATSDFSAVSKVWDAASGQELFTLSGGDAAFSLNDGGKHLVTISPGKVTTITTWEVTSGQAINTIPVQVDTEEKGFLLTPDWTRLTVAEPDGTIGVWDATTSAAQPEPVFKLVGHTDDLTDMAFSPDGTRWATASNDETARIWEASTGKLLFTLTGHSNGVEGVAFSPDGRYLATSGDGIARIWDAATGEERINFIAGGYGDITFGPDGLHVATIQDRIVKIWDLTRGLQEDLPPSSNIDVTNVIIEQSFWLRGHSGQILGVVFNSDGTRLISTGRDGTARVWDISPAGAKEWLTLTSHSGDWYIRDVEFSPDGSRLATASPDKTAKVWDAVTGQELLTLVGHTNAVKKVIFSPDSTRLATASEDHTAKVWDARTGRELLTLAGHTDLINDVVFSPDGVRLATAGEDRTAKIWDALTGQEILTLTSHNDFVESVAFSPDGIRLVTGSGDSTAKIWDALTGRELFTLTGHTDTIMDIAFSPDGVRLATASFDGTVKLWQAATGQELFSLTRDQYPIVEVAFSPEGTRLAAASWGNRVIVWDISDTVETGTIRGEELLTLPSEGSTVAFSPDGRLLVTGNNTDTTTRVYILPLNELLTLAHSRLTRTWTEAECRQYLHVAACPAGDGS